METGALQDLSSQVAWEESLGKVKMRTHVPFWVGLFVMEPKAEFSWTVGV